MSSAFQNRLVGTVILVALAVIFLPDILDGKKAAHKDSFVAVPEQPESRPVAETQPFPVEAVKQRANRKVEIVNETAVDDPAPQTQEQPIVETTQSASQSSPLSSETQQPVNDYPVAEAGEPENEAVSAGWVVQLGSFRHNKNVQELKTTLKKAGYRVFTRQVTTSAGELTKVFVGPELKREPLEQALPHLNQLTSLKGKITTFKVD
ncbi:Cell division protein DedD [Saliniradius amylolyticus]|uniref:Cell division protein DedD n=1 Tax=Saliniradius amylolyticus TaxID=2183582 RepID=A0A2S2E499_9ALTE|nr:SPOR domain-containing protein [Saliniradius amylolyticus]AWL12419.1 Cell division protein DedD [Saliniradius amylolyticus]